jgi:hypothetical protein
VVEQRLISLLMSPLCFPEWDVIGNPISYGLYQRRRFEHITPIDHIPLERPRPSRERLTMTSSGPIAGPEVITECGAGCRLGPAGSP